MIGALYHLGSSHRWDSSKCNNHGLISRLLTKFQVRQQHMDSLQSVTRVHEWWFCVTSSLDPLGVSHFHGEFCWKDRVLENTTSIAEDLSSQGIYIHCVSEMRM
ncbi:hypothetical protein MKX03_005253 [Papaver bracteatum]|nr:hypothetical protein MKX03_005253 [Papaver bracteatum]